MKKIFVSYGSEPFYGTLKRIRKEARRLRIFDKVITYTDRDLPAYIRQSSLFNYSRGGGYWVWKPYVILKTMQRYPNAIIVYADAGCSLNQNVEEWQFWFQQMDLYDMLITQYQSNKDYGWYSAFHTKSVKISTWTKKLTLDFFDNMFGNTEWHNYNKIWAGMMIIRRNPTLLQEWLDIMLSYPELVADPTDEELPCQNDGFIAHRHDQSILTPLVYWYSKEHRMRICVLPETAESNASAAVVASRITQIEKVSLKTRVVRVIKSVIGENIYQFLHFWK